MSNNILGGLVDLDIVDEAYDHITSRHPDLTSATICYSFFALGQISSASFKPGSVTKIDPTLLTNDPINGLPNLSLCSPGQVFQVASRYALNAQPAEFGSTPMVG